MRFGNRPRPTRMLAATTCDVHLPAALRQVAPASAEATGNTDTHVLVHRIELPEPEIRCDTCGAPADWHLTTMEVFR